MEARTTVVDGEVAMAALKGRHGAVRTM